jgi:PilZ domain
MDPHLYAEQPGLTPDSRITDDGADYLRRLKAQGPEVAVDSTSRTALAAGAAQTPLSGKERRRSARFQCSGSAELKVEGSDVRMWGTLTDVSLHGCYVEMSTPFPVGTKADLVLEALGFRVRALGTVRVSYPFLGMGICLTKVEPGQQAQLEQLLAAVAGKNAAPDPALTQDRGPTDAVAAAEPAAFLAEIKQFFDSRRILSREEFFQIAKRCQRRI